MTLIIIRASFFFSTLQVIHSILYYTILYYTILYYTILYIYIYIYVCYILSIQCGAYIYSTCTPPQYLTQGGIETIREYLETRSDKSIDIKQQSVRSCKLQEELKYHPERGFAIGTKFTPPYSDLLKKRVIKQKFSKQ